MLVAVGGLGRTRGFVFTSMRSEGSSGSPFMGSVWFSCRYFSISLRSNIWLEIGDRTGCSGTSLLMEQIRAMGVIATSENNKT